ncbi:M10 family metallopeptidase C-terminal domain-containing protein [Yoonia sp. 208BN28-4]|uniref:M10 family metallopeptidase C-terminal domain-containing protein n=1 Tax=Yoonia sp. 208BN28-4 TaxID=3126505 RepID=UPI00309E0009
MTVVDSHWDTDQCCCQFCMESLAREWEDTGTIMEPPVSSDDETLNPYDKPIWSAYETAQHLARQGSTWADDGNIIDGKTAVTYYFYDGSAADDPINAFEEINQINTRKILDQYAEVGLLVFNEVADPLDDPDITFKYRDGQNGGGYWNGQEVVVSRVGWEPEMEPGTYNQNLMLHEIGHALGLNHPGAYNGGGSNYVDNAEYWNDSGQYSNMSYWSESNTGASFGQLSTLGLHDILAIQIEYGVNTSTRTGDDTYGFNATAGNAYDFDSTRTNGSGSERSNIDMAFSIWDAAGNDTLDLSGSGVAVDLDLREGAFSSTNGRVYNVSIAYGAVVENGVGSDHNDTLRGNAANNVLFGGLGDDVMIGGSDSYDATPDPRAFTGVLMNNDPVQFDQYLAAEGLTALSQPAFTIDMMVDITRMSSRETTFVSYATAGNADTFLVQGRNDGMLRIEINGEIIDTDIETLSLIDGNSHRLSVGWEAATGQLRVHIDGAVAWTGTLQAGAVIGTGGTLVFGQDQDNLGGGFDIRQTFQGVIGDMRIFDGQRSDAAIAQDAFSAPAGPAPVHHWSVTDQSATQIIDIGAGGLIDFVATDPTNVTATQSSQYGSYTADFAIDGNVDTFNHTWNDAQEYLSIAFDTAVEAQLVEVINRASSSFRLDGVVVEFYDADGTLAAQSAPITGASWQSAHLFEVPDGITLSEVRVVNAGQYLHVSEIRVLGGNGATKDLSVMNGATVVPVGEAIIVSDADSLFGGDGADSMYGGFGDDSLHGEADNDSLFGGAGTDKLHGGDGDDRLYGGAGNDRVFSGKGQDDVFLGSGDDYVRVGGGVENFSGGAGNDYISYFDSSNGVKLNLEKGTASGSWASNDTVTGFESVGGSRTGSDHITGTSGANVIRTYGGNDKVYAGAGADKVELGDGNDYVRVGGGVESFDGGAGTDYISYYDSSNGVRIDLEADQVSGSWAVNDTIRNFESAAGSRTGNDMLLGSADANMLRGYGGDDRLYGRAGADTLYGGSGDDFLDGGDGPGVDVLYGGAGADEFHFDRGEGTDVVKDFESTIDKIALDNFAFAVGEAFDYAAQLGAHVVFDFGDDGHLTVENTTVALLENDLILV